LLNKFFVTSKRRSRSRIKNFPGGGAAYKRCGLATLIAIIIRSLTRLKIGPQTADRLFLPQSKSRPHLAPGQRCICTRFATERITHYVYSIRPAQSQRKGIGHIRGSPITGDGRNKIKEKPSSSFCLKQSTVGSVHKFIIHIVKMHCYINNNFFALDQINFENVSGSKVSLYLF
jgi:hypothetical protein